MNSQAKPSEAVVVVGDFNTSKEQVTLASDTTLTKIEKAGFFWTFAGIPLEHRITIPGKGKYPDACFDHIYARNLGKPAAGFERHTGKRSFSCGCGFGSVESPLDHSPMRTTRRKALIEETLATEFDGGVALLDELRWKVYLKETTDVSTADLVMTRSYCNSFVRTLQSSMPGIAITRLGRPDEVASGIVTRLALYRLAEWKTITAFLSAQEHLVFTRYQGSLQFGKHKSHPEVRVEFYERDPKALFTDRLKECLAHKLIPVNSPLCVVSFGAAGDDAIERLTDIPWAIFRHSSGLTPIAPSQPVRTPWRRWKQRPLSQGLLSFDGQQQPQAAEPDTEDPIF